MISETALTDHLASIGIVVDVHHPFLLGNVCKSVYPAMSTNGERLVVKVGGTAEADREILLNQQGYTEAREIGADRLLPNKLEFMQFQDVPIIVMSDCGEDFLHAVQKAEDPVRLYEMLLMHMKVIYAETRRPSRRPWLAMEQVKSILQRVYAGHLGEHVSPSTILKLESWDVKSCITPWLSFSSFDFTPEDVFVTEQYAKYVDPKPGLLGVPILDLACFAGVARDAYQLPGSGKGYQLIEECARGEIAELLQVSDKVATMMFGLGRAVQLGLSGHFRLEREEERALRMISDGERLIKELI